MIANLSTEEKSFLAVKVWEIDEHNADFLNNPLYELHRSVPIYCWLLSEFDNQSLEIDSNFVFQIVFSSFYGIRFAKKAWRKNFYEVMQRFRKEKDVQIETVINELHNDKKSIQFSFITKMLNLINPDNPIFDYNVGVFLELGKSQEKSVVEVYQKLCEYYNYLLNDDKIKNCLKEFDNVFPTYAEKLSRVRKIDYLLWCAGKPTETRK